MKKKIEMFMLKRPFTSLAITCVVAFGSGWYIAKFAAKKFKLSRYGF